MILLWLLKIIIFFIINIAIIIIINIITFIVKLATNYTVKAPPWRHFRNAGPEILKLMDQSLSRNKLNLTNLKFDPLIQVNSIYNDAVICLWGRFT